MRRTARSAVQPECHRQEGEHEKVRLERETQHHGVTGILLRLSSCPGLATYSVTLGKVCASVLKIYRMGIILPTLYGRYDN